jgi:hypothetical protein
VRATPPNPPILQPRVAPDRSAASPHPTCRATPSAVAEPPPVVATLRGHQVFEFKANGLGHTLLPQTNTVSLIREFGVSTVNRRIGDE